MGVGGRCLYTLRQTRRVFLHSYTGVEGFTWDLEAGEKGCRTCKKASETGAAKGLWLRKEPSHVDSIRAIISRFSFYLLTPILYIRSSTRIILNLYMLYEAICLSIPTLSGISKSMFLGRLSTQEQDGVALGRFLGYDQKWNNPSVAVPIEKIIERLKLVKHV